MDTNTKPTQSGLIGRHYRSHPPEFKRRVVEESYLPGASVARTALANGINANQLFAWRKLFREQTAAAASVNAATFLSVAVREAITESPAPRGVSATPDAGNVRTGKIEVTVGKAQLTIHGSPDVTLLRVVLAELLR